MTELRQHPRHAMLFPPEVAYLNTAYMGPLPLSAIEAGRAALERKARPWTIIMDDFFDPLEGYRNAIAELIGLDADGVAVTPSTSYGMSTLAKNVGLKSGDVVVVPGDEFPSGWLCWQEAAEQVGATIIRVSPERGDRCGPLLQTIAEHGERVAVVSVPPCHWTDGTRFDLLAIAQSCKRVGAALAVDTAQSLGAVPFNGTELAPDLVTGVTYKWLLGPYSLAFAWFSPAWREARPLEQAWNARIESHHAAGLIEPSPLSRPGGRRFDMAQAAQHTGLSTALAGIALVSEWIPAETAEHSQTLMTYLADAADSAGFTPTKAEFRSPHLVGLTVPESSDATTVAQHLAAQKIHVSVRGSSLRVSIHRFNTEDDVRSLIVGLGGEP